jgi:hypothetical protein
LLHHSETLAPQTGLGESKRTGSTHPRERPQADQTASPPLAIYTIRTVKKCATRREGTKEALAKNEKDQQMADMATSCSYLTIKTFLGTIG